MKLIDHSIALTVAFALQFSVAFAKHSNAHIRALERLHEHHRSSHASKAEEGQGIELRAVDVEKRTGKCQFPTDAGLVVLRPGQLLSVCLSPRTSHGTMGSRCDILLLPTVNGWFSDLPTVGSAILTEHRTEDSIATKAESLRSRSQINPTVSTGPVI